MRLTTYFKYWVKNSSLTLQALLATRLASILFVLGKFIRFFFFWWFLLVIKDRVNQVSGYQIDDLVIFYLIYNLFDLIAQFFFRGIYWYRNEIVSGTFDFKLVKPLSPLFKVMTDHTDFLDLPLLALVVIVLVVKLQTVSWSSLLAFAWLSLASLVVMTAIHIVVAAIGLLTTEVDHTIWIFRDLASMARVPVDIYTDFIRGFLTFVVPVALVFTFPAKALLGLLSPLSLALIFTSAFIIFLLALKFWQYSLQQYSSASS